MTGFFDSVKDVLEDRVLSGITQYVAQPETLTDAVYDSLTYQDAVDTYMQTVIMDAYEDIQAYDAFAANSEADDFFQFITDRDNLLRDLQVVDGALAKATDDDVAALHEEATINVNTFFEDAGGHMEEVERFLYAVDAAFNEFTVDTDREAERFAADSENIPVMTRVVADTYSRDGEDAEDALTRFFTDTFDLLHRTSYVIHEGSDASLGPIKNEGLRWAANTFPGPDAAGDAADHLNTYIEERCNDIFT